MIRRQRDEAPAPLLVAASLVVVEAIVLVSLAVVELVALDWDRAALGVTTTLAFILFAAGLVYCAWLVVRGRSFGRAPIVLAQLIQMLTATSFWGGDTTLIAVAMLIVGAVVLVGILHPASIEHLEEHSA